MKICYVDEAGCTGMLPSINSDIQPTLNIVGLIVDYGSIHKLTDNFIDIKRKYYPRLAPTNTTNMGWILPEIKGNELRNDVCKNNRNNKRHAFGVLDSVIASCEAVSAKLLGRVWIKGIGTPLKGVSVYTFSIQSIYDGFQNYLRENDDFGIVILDSRLKHLNTQVAHSIFTQKFKSSGDSYDRIVELPAFSHSDNHAGLQIVDIIASGIVTPMAINTYCEGVLTSIHVKPGYSNIKDRYAERIKNLQHRIKEASGRTRGGFVVSDGLGKEPGFKLFQTAQDKKMQHEPIEKLEV